MVVEKSKAWKEEQQIEPSSGSAASAIPHPHSPQQIFPKNQPGDDKHAVPVVSPEKGTRANSFSSGTGNMSLTSDRKPAAVVFNDKSSRSKVKAEKKQGSDSSSEHGGVDSKEESSATVESAGKRKAKSECTSSGEEVDKVSRVSKSLRTQQEKAWFASKKASGQEKDVRLSLSQEKYLQTMRKNLEKRGNGPTASYCILKALYVSSAESLSKPDLKKDAEQFYKKPMESNPPLLHSKGYGPWSTITSTLEKHHLVKRQKGGSKDDYFSLTAEGRSFCEKLFTVVNKKPAPATKPAPPAKSPGQDIRTFFAIR